MLPTYLQRLGKELPRAKVTPNLTSDEKVKVMKDNFNLSHGKGKRKRKGRKKK